MVVFIYIVKHDAVREIKLNERLIEDASGERKREILTMILDYANCKWRKVKRTCKEK